MRPVAFAALMMVAAIGGPVAAQSSAPQSSTAQAPAALAPEETLLDELVVNAKLPGPAWWRVSDGDTTIYVLGTPSALPKGLAWDKSVLDRRLTGAFALITPPSASAGLRDTPAMIGLVRNMRSKTPLLEALPPEQAARLTAALKRMGKSPDAYENWKPLAAGMLLAQDFRKSAKLDSGEPDGTIRSMARKKKVRIVPAATYKAMPAAKAIVRDHTAAVGLACFDVVLDEVETGTGRLRAAGQAWAAGEVRTSMSGVRGYERCAAQLPGATELNRKALDDQTEALARAMKTPGHAVAIMGVRSLVSEGGVLDRLRARGFTVKTPGE